MSHPVKVEVYPKPDFWTPSIILNGETGAIEAGSGTTGTEGRLSTLELLMTLCSQPTMTHIRI